MRSAFLICALILTLLFSSCSFSVTDNSLTIGVVLDNSEKSDLHKASIISACKSLEIKEDSVIIETDVSEMSCFNKLTELIEDGCDVLFAVGDGFEDYVIQAAQENPYIRFCYYGGNSHLDIRPDNFYTYAVDTSQQNYLAGIVAGYKLNELYENGILTKDKLKLGYIGALPDAGSISDYTAFYIGAKTVCESVKMDVHFTGSYEDDASELSSAKVLIAMGCAVISQHSVSESVAAVCEENGVFFVSNGKSFKNTGQTCRLVSKDMDYTACYTYAMKKVINGESLPQFWVCGAKDNVQPLAGFNTEAFQSEETLLQAQDVVTVTLDQLANNQIGVFNINRFTVNGQKVETTMTDELYKTYVGVEYINKYNCFAEYQFCSAPKFSFAIDGITQLNANEFSSNIGG